MEMTAFTLLFVLPVLAAIVYYALRYIMELVPDSVGPSTRSKRCVFISGCDSGFGRLLALKLAAKGTPTFAGCLTQEGIESITKESATMREPIRAVQLDVTSDRSVEKAAGWVKDQLEEANQGATESKEKRVLWAVVNNAGIFSCYGPDAWCEIEDYQHSIEVNLYGVIRCTHALLPLLKQSKGRIVNIASVAGRVSVPCGAPYAVAKYGVEAYTDAIRLELAPFGVTCHLLEPSLFRTNLVNQEAMQKRVNAVWKRLSPELRKEYGEEYKDKFVNSWNGFVFPNSSPRLDWVVDAYHHAITARFPRLRYRCGWEAVFFYIPVSFLPTWLSDLIFTKLVMDQPDAPVPAALQQKSNGADHREDGGDGKGKSGGKTEDGGKKRE